MCPQPHEGSAEEGLSCSVLRLVDSPERIERLRYLFSGFSHRCRNSLNGIKMSLYLSKRQRNGPSAPCWSEFERTYQEIERIFDRLQAIYRPLSVTVVHSPVGQLINERLPSWRSLFGARGLTLEIEPPEQEAPGDFDPMHLGLALDAFVAWRADCSSTLDNPRLSWRVDAGFIEIVWSEGPARKRRGPPAEPTSRSRSVDWLALPLLGRIISAHGGSHEVTCQQAFRLKLRWPQHHAGGPRTPSESPNPSGTP